MLMMLLLEKSNSQTVAAPPLPPLPPPPPPPPPLPMYMTSSGPRPVNKDVPQDSIDYPWLLDYILGGTGRRGPQHGAHFSQFAVFRSIYDMAPQLFNVMSYLHTSTDTGESYFSFMYSPGRPHWDIKFHVYGVVEVCPATRTKFKVARVAWYMGKKGSDSYATGHVLYGPGA